MTGVTYRTEQTLEAVADHVAAAVTLCSRELQYVWANSRYAEWLRRPVETIVRRPIVEVLGVEAFETLLPHFERVLAGEFVAYEDEVPFLNIGPRWISAAYTPTRDATGLVDGWVATIQDITDRKRLEDDLLSSRRRLAADADALIRLNEWTARLHETTELLHGVDQMLMAVMSLMGADKGDVQLLGPERGVLRIVAQRGFAANSVELSADDPSWGRALQSGARIIVEDLETDPRFPELRSIARSSGFRAVMSTPLTTSEGQSLGMVSTHFAAPHRPADESLRLVDLYVRQAASFIQRCLAEQQLKQSEERLRNLNEELEQRIRERTSEVQALLARVVDVQREERHRIARDIHDHLGQEMTALRVHTAVMKECAAGGELSRLADRMQSIAEKLDVSIDAITTRLQPAVLGDLGLWAAVRELIASWSCRFDIAVECSGPDEEVRLSGEVEEHLYLLIEEALQNIAQHAEATQVHVTFSKEDEWVVLTVEDNGRGFDPSTPRQPSRLGLINMRERIGFCGGELEVRSVPAEGTSIALRVPCSTMSTSTLGN